MNALLSSLLSWAEPIGLSLGIASLIFACVFAIKWLWRRAKRYEAKQAFMTRDAEDKYREKVNTLEALRAVRRRARMSS